MKGRVLIIAGSDSGGGAGIQADIKAATALGAYAATAVTAVTVQDTVKVHAVHPVPEDIVRQQIEVVLSDIGADCIKIGLVATVSIGRTVLDVLERYADIPVVLDPVLVATSGDRLGEGEVGEFIRGRMVPRAEVVTPNLPELEALAGQSARSNDDVEAAALELLNLGAGAVLAKGGHGEGDTVRDRLITASGTQLFEAPRQQTTNTHGTGCTLASAVAAGLAQGMAVQDACARAIQYVQEAIRTAPGLGQGHGPLNHQPWGSKGD